MRLIVSICVCWVLSVSAAKADSWPTAKTRAKASESGEFVVRISPGQSSQHAKEAFATAEWFRFSGRSYERVRSVSLLNPIAPADFEVTDQGRLVTIDNWGGLGSGYVVAVYLSSGEQVSKYALTDLYSRSAIEKMKRSVSSTQWRCPGFSVSLASQNELRVDDSIGGHLVFQLESGKYRYEQGSVCK